ncbi:acyltransferase family protein [Streptosporangium sp. NPDC050855]|uniref:acyltransferase family protein n=1 Tax=Streptosporangium sp. NPDC050855 TaxID=3366194 RepID=UPI0037B78072
MADLVSRIEAATPADRDRGMDALRALAILGVVAGHWLVTSWVHGPGGRVRLSSPLAHLPALTPASWVLQTLAVFFFVGGYAAARSLRPAADRHGRQDPKDGEGQHGREGPKDRHVREDGSRRLRARMRRLLGPAVPLVLVWAGTAAGMALRGTPVETIRSMALPAVGPLWFLAVFAALTAATPLLLRVRPGVTAVVAFAVVLGTDLVRFGLGGPAWVGWANLVAGWLVPYALGIALAGGMLASRRVAAGLLACGAAGAVTLVAGFGYPASMVGVTGAAVSNLGPPTLAAVCFGLAQVGLALLVREPLTRLMRRPRVWAAVALVNLSAMTIFLWHQTAPSLIAVAALRFGDVPGLLGLPAEPAWIAYRLAWLPVFAAVLALAWLPRPAPRRPVLGRPVPKRPVPEGPVPEGPVPERPVQERPVLEGPSPGRPGAGSRGPVSAGPGRAADRP